MTNIKELIEFIISAGLLSYAMIKYNTKSRIKESSREEENKVVVQQEAQPKRITYKQKAYHTLAYTELIFENASKSPVFLQKNVYTDRHWKCKLATTKEADYYEFYYLNQYSIGAIITAVNKSMIKHLDCDINFVKKEILPIAHKMCTGEISIDDAILAFQNAELVGINEYNNPEEDSFAEELYLIMPNLILGGTENGKCK
jgi:hypothetical protein